MNAQHHDVLIVGAGLSGIGAACRLTDRLPDKSFAILEARDAIGGTWDLFRYPGIRSDSDMFTLGYSFRPRQDSRSIADGGSIRDYVHDTAREWGVEDKIRFGHRVVRADWDSAESHWVVTVERAGETAYLTCGFLYWCSGYYRYDEGFTPRFTGTERFRGQIVHPQHWPEDLDYSGKRVVVIGSGATAMTLVPSLTDRAEHVTMLQRSPTYVVSRPRKDKIAALLQRYLPDGVAYDLIRRKNVAEMTFIYQLSRRQPGVVKKLIRGWLEQLLPKDFDIDTHFTPRYEPWDQRLCLVPDADLFRALCTGNASVVTDRIATFTEDGLLLESGEELPADIVVTATGLNLQLFGGAEISVDGRPVSNGDSVVYKGMMFSDVPNMVLALGYTNMSWTLKCDLVGDYVVRLLKHMDEHGYTSCTSVAPPESEPLDSLLDFQAGYVLRALDSLPKQGARTPWRLNQSYYADKRMFQGGALEDEGMRFDRAPIASEGKVPA